MKKGRRVHHLASRANLSIDDVISILRAEGIAVTQASDQVSRSRTSDAEVALGIDQKTLLAKTPSRQAFIKPTRSENSDFGHSASLKANSKGDSVVRLDTDSVLMIRRRMAKMLIAERDAFGSTEPIWGDKFEMAVNRQFTSGGGIYKYQTVAATGAALAYGLTLSHAFENGNKRTALVSLLVFLNRNKMLLSDITEDDLYNLMASIARHDIKISGNKARNSDSEVRAIEDWIDQHARDLELGDKNMEFPEFRKLLVDQGCELDSPKGNYIKIHREGYAVKTGYPRENFTIPVQEVKKVRAALRLDEMHGYDSQGFYNLNGAVDDFVNKHRNLMRRLADL